MEAHERTQAERVLARIPRERWSAFLDGAEGAELRDTLDAVRHALRESGHVLAGAPRRPVSETIDLLGHRLLSRDGIGSWLREHLLRALPQGKWQRLAEQYRLVAGARAAPLHGNMSQDASGSRVLAEYWHQGGRWARIFCEATGLPEVLARRRPSPLPADEEIVPVEPLPPLHDFQIEAYKGLRKLLRDGLGRAAMLSLPTGAGKTRVTVEAICDHLAEDGELRRRRNVVLWIAPSHELQTQAWECIRQVWQVPPRRAGAPIRRPVPLRIVRLWGGRDPDAVEVGDEATVLVAGIDQLASWARRRPDFFESLPQRRLACVVVDEAHSLVTHEHGEVLKSLNLRAKREWRTLQGAPPVIGLSATPWRSNDDESAILRKYFQRTLLRPSSLEDRPISSLQRRGILARVRPERLKVTGVAPMSEVQRRRFEQFKELPADYLEQLGREHHRNARILDRLRRLPKRSRVLVFACSINHAEILTVALNRAFGDDSAAVVTSETPRAERADVIERFRNGGLRFLCNVGVLTTGFDAPKADAVCVTRPTTSALRYEQMVGRGLRGPKNGGTERCVVLDVQDEGLPDAIQSYERVLGLWEQ